MVSIQVYWSSSGNKADGIPVSLSFDSPPRTTSTNYTDSQGIAHFDSKPGTGTVYANHKPVYTGMIQDYTKVYI